MILGFGLALLLSSVRSELQDALPPAVKVVIGTDGSVKVIIDAQTGKLLSSDVWIVPRPKEASGGTIRYTPISNN